MACPAPKEELHRNVAKGDPGSKLAGCLLRKQMKECTSHCWDSVRYGVLEFLEVIAWLGFWEKKCGEFFLLEVHAAENRGYRNFFLL